MSRDFGSYELGEKIGAGGMATVYTAIQKSLKRKVVLKILHEHLAQERSILRRFEREAESAANLHHENIVQIIDYEEDNGTFYIAMEYVGENDLKKWIDAHDTPPIEIALPILLDICSGLEHAHERGIIHRDIKLANLLLTATGVAKITDFGLSRSMQETTVITMQGTVLGTVPYMSPEAAKGRPVDKRSDIFSLGVVAYELLGGRRPFEGDSAASIITQIVNEAPEDLSARNPLVSSELGALVMKMLEKNPDDRFQDLRGVKDALRSAMAGLGIHKDDELVSRYMNDPEKVAVELAKQGHADHLSAGHKFMGMGLGRIDDAILEFRRALHLSPESREANEGYTKARSRKPISGNDGGFQPDEVGRARPVAGASRKKWLLPLAVAVLLMSFAGIGWRAYGPGGESSSEGAPVSVDNTEIDIADQGEADPQPIPSQDTALTQPVVMEPDPDTVVVQPPTPATGEIRVVSTPAADLSLNGERVARNVSDFEWEIPAGRHSIRLAHSYYKTKVWPDLRLAKGQTLTLRHDFAKVAGPAYLTVLTGRVPAKIWIDGVLFEEWTPQRGIELPPGPHRIRVAREGYDVKEGEVERTLVEGTETELSFSLHQF